jgi:hypothetical protein
LHFENHSYISDYFPEVRFNVPQGSIAILHSLLNPFSLTCHIIPCALWSLLYHYYSLIAHVPKNKNAYLSMHFSHSPVVKCVMNCLVLLQIL